MFTLPIIAGVDEVGRGCLAGPVMAAAVILNPLIIIDGIKDSKQLSPKKRETLSGLIKEKALNYAFGRATPEEIDQLNILQATLLAMKRAVEALTLIPNLVLVDGLFCPSVDCKTKAIVHGDETEIAIGAASIIAKVARDQEMRELETFYPGYGLDVHKGYATAQHLKALTSLGVSPIHRRSFKPVANSVSVA